MPTKFSETESRITQLFKKGQTFYYQSIFYTVKNSGKPSPSKGECKTDTYVLAEDKSGNEKEFKISIKQKNADFLENKMSFDRATQIFGINTSKILIKALESIKDEFINDYLVTFSKYKKTEAKTLKIGWKFELVNKKSGNKSGLMALTSPQIFDVYAGNNLDNTKKNSKVNGSIISNSGVANFILEVEYGNKDTCQQIVNSIVPIEEFINGKQIYFACKAINYRTSKNKWDGNRPLAVYIDWQVQNNQIHSKVILDKPLETKANKIGENIKSILHQFNISTNNFNELKSILVDTQYFE